MPGQKKIGRVLWTDLTVPDAEPIRDFYAAVVGWTFDTVDMGGYSDFSMNEPIGGEGVCGICCQRGDNAHIPAVWMNYVGVAKLEESLAKVQELGGKLIGPIREFGGHSRFCVIQDPAGAYLTLWENGD